MKTWEPLTSTTTSRRRQRQQDDTSATSAAAPDPCRPHSDGLPRAMTDRTSRRRRQRQQDDPSATSTPAARDTDPDCCRFCLYVSTNKQTASTTPGRPIRDYAAGTRATDPGCRRRTARTTDREGHFDNGSGRHRLLTTNRTTHTSHNTPQKRSFAQGGRRIQYQRYPVRKQQLRSVSVRVYGLTMDTCAYIFQRTRT